MQKYTLKELADIGAKASLQHITGTYAAMAVSDRSSAWERERPAREAFTKAILDAIGYQLPKDEEREAFDAWCESNNKLNTPGAFEIWKAGREELRKAINKPSYSIPPDCLNTGVIFKKPAWIPWNGGECPLSDKVHRWQYKNRDGFVMDCPGYKPKSYNWKHRGKSDDIIAYRVWE